MTLTLRKKKVSYQQILNAARQLPPTQQHKLSNALAQASDVRIISPSGDALAMRRGQRLAKQIHRKLSASIAESLDETMSKMRGRSWS